MNDRTKSEAELRLEAMLYLLNDPALDVVEFESRLETDSRLDEILAESVLVYQSLMAVDFQSISLAALSAKGTFDQANKQINDALCGVTTLAVPAQPLSKGSWVAVAAIAASLLLVGFFGLHLARFDVNRPAEIATSPASANSSNSSLTHSDANAWGKIVWAWGELQTSDYDDQVVRSLNFPYIENGSAPRDAFCDCDVPEWLVLATAAAIEDGNSIDDTSIDSIESRTLIQ